MLGRGTELKNLNSYYDRDGSQILVLYGQHNIGKRQLIKEFIADKPYHYYLARGSSEKEQQYQWGQQLAEEGIKTLNFPSFLNIFDAIVSQNEAGKLVLMIDEFSNIIKNSDSFIKELVQFVHSQWKKHQVMVILMSSNVGFIENSMVNRIGEAAYELSGLLKIRELSFHELTAHFTGYKVDECIETYAILGGYPGLWECFDDRLTVKENICRNILNPKSFLFSETIHMMEEQLREMSVYSTILAAIAAGNNKLNDLYEHTGFSRAKISVYLKNLMELELVEKVFSYDTAGKDNVQKGIYRISNHLAHFYFTFMYPHLSELYNMSANHFYQRFVAPHFRHFVSGYFSQVCAQNIEMRNQYGHLPIRFTSSGEWVGKVGNIDLIGQDDENHTLVCLCNWDKPMMTYDDYEWLLFCCKKAKITADYIYLFSAGNFDEKLNLERKVKKNLTLIDVSSL